MDTYKECYGQYNDNFKSTFSYVPAASFSKGAINMGIINDTSDQARNYRGGLIVAIFGLNF